MTLGFLSDKRLFFFFQKSFIGCQNPDKGNSQRQLSRQFNGRDEDLLLYILAETYPDGVPRHTHSTTAQVMRAPLLAGDRKPRHANTEVI